MSEQEKYDELIRQKFAEKEFIFNEENWEKAEKILDLSKRSKKIFWWSSIFLTGLITGICVMLLLTREKTHVMNNYPGQELKNLKPIQHNSNSSGSQQKLNAPFEKSLINDVVPIDSIKSLEQNFNLNESGSSANDNDKPIYANNAPDGNQAKRATFRQMGSSFSLNSARIKHASSVKTLKQNAGNNTDKRENKNLLSGNSNESDAKNLNLLKTATVSVRKKNKKKNKNTAILNTAAPKIMLAKQDGAASNKKGSKLTVDKKEATKKRTIALTKKSSKAPDTVEKNETSTDSSNNVELKDSAALELVTQKNLSPADSISDSVKQEEKKLVAADSLQPHADSSQAQNAVVAPLPMDGLASITLLSIEAGVNGQVGWKYDNTNQVEGRGITPILGIGVTHCFNQKWSLYSALQYGSIAYLKASTKTYTTTKYSFGSLTTETVIKPGILNYLVVPLRLQYHFNENNAIVAGGNISFLLNKKNKAESKYSQVAPVPVYNTSNSSLNSVDASVPGGYYASSFNRLDASIGLGYRRKINSHFFITATANYGLLDIKRDSFFSQNKFERNSSLKLVLSYTIFDF